MMLYGVNFNTAIPDTVWEMIRFEKEVALAAKKKMYNEVYDDTHTCEYVFDDNWQLQKINGRP